jgi:phage FluMu protein Com
MEDDMKLNQSCNLCGSVFAWDTETFQKLGLKTIPKKCPTCKDVQGMIKPEHHVVIERILLQEWDAILWEIKIKNAEFRKAEDKDKPAYRWTLTKEVPGYGSQHGVRWNGERFVFWFIGFENGLPDNEPVRIRRMRVVHKGAVRMKYHKQYEYLVVEPSDSEIIGSIDVFTAAYKTTLKGFGRQWRQEFQFTGEPEIVCSLKNWCNSQRFGCNTLIAICDPESDIETIETDI